MIEFLKNEKPCLKRYARETRQVLKGSYARTELKGMEYAVTITPDLVKVNGRGSNNISFTVPTIEFMAYMEMFRDWK